MTGEEYREKIKEKGKYIIMVDLNEIYKVFDSPQEATDYAIEKIRHTKTNKIDVYKTTGKTNTVLSGGCVCRDDIEPYQRHHIGINW